MNRIDPKQYGLSARVKLEWIEKDHIKIILHRKSRIIMKDGQRILDMAKQITNIDSSIKVSLGISGPICGKTIKSLMDSGIQVDVDNS